MSDEACLRLAERILDIARSEDLLIATAESCTGGLIAAALTEIPGSSDVFDRGFVTYSNAAKMQMLGVRQNTLDAHGAVSVETAAEMADGALRHSHAEFAVSVTGIAGPGGGSPDKPVGLVCFGLARAGDPVRTESICFEDAGRAGVRAAAQLHALTMLHDALVQAAPESARP